MKKQFIVTQNVKKFIDLTEKLKSAPANLPKMALVYGDYGLGKSQTILWWVTNNDAIYVRCNHKMSPRWLLSEIVEELDEIPCYQSAHLFKQIEDKLKFNTKILVIEEIDVGLNKASAIEVVRDLHDKIGIPIVLVGMSLAEQKLKRFKHIYDRLLRILKFQLLTKSDVQKIIKELADVDFKDEVTDLICNKYNQFRRLVKLINKIENIAKINGLDLITKEIPASALNQFLTRLCPWGFRYI